MHSHTCFTLNFLAPNLVIRWATSQVCDAVGYGPAQAETHRKLASSGVRWSLTALNLVVCPLA